MILRSVRNSHRRLVNLRISPPRSAPLRIKCRRSNPKRTSTEQDLSRAFSQKRDFESRLSQLRTAYEQEVAEVRTLEDRLSKSRTETTQLQRDFAMLEGTHQDIQSQHERLTEALDADQAENTSLREKIRQVNAQIGTLKTQLEKLRLDAKKAARASSHQQEAAVNKRRGAREGSARDRRCIQSICYTVCASGRGDGQSFYSFARNSRSTRHDEPASTPTIRQHDQYEPFFPSEYYRLLRSWACITIRESQRNLTRYQHL